MPGQIQSQTLYLLFSPLLGYGVSDLLERLDPASALLLVEFDGTLAELYSHRFSLLSPELPVNAGCARDHDTALAIADRFVKRYGIRRVETVHLTGGSRLNSTEYDRLTRAVQNLIQRFWSNRGTQIRLGRRWIANLVRNVQLESRPITDSALPIAPTVILIGAGPNLDHHLAILRDPPEHTTLVALDTALPTLAAFHIVPDVVVSMDGQLANAQDLLPWRWDQTTLLADLTVHPSIPRRFAPERRCFFLSRFADISLLDDAICAGIPLIPPRGSVAPAALDILVRFFGVRRIRTIGIDFWYRPPRSHAWMSRPDRFVRATMTRLLHADGYQGLLNRPVRNDTLRDGTAVQCDAVLGDHADQMKHLVNTLRERYGNLHIWTSDSGGLDTGATVNSSSTGEAVIGREPDLTADKGITSPDYRSSAQEDIRALLHRLNVQEAKLAGPGRYVILDASLDFILLDLPQWPLLVLKQEWAQLHRSAILRSLRDFRRRIDRALQAHGLDT